MTESVRAISIKDFFVNFFKTFQTPDGAYKYREKISQMPIYKSRSLVIDFDDLLSFDKSIANLLIENPKTVIKEASEAIREVMLVENREYAESVERFIARFRGVPYVVPLRGLRSIHINKLITVEGIVTRISPVKQQLVEAVFRCENCGNEVVVPQPETGIVQPTECPVCSKIKKKKTSFRLIPEKSKFIDWQKLVLQEKPEELPPGQLPRSIEVIVKEDLVDIVRPGDRATITGILLVQQEHALRKDRPPIFKVYLEANYIEVSSRDTYDIEITPEDEKIILELAKDPNIKEKIISSIAPSIHGYRKIKEAIACLLFGGEPKVFPDGVKVRGDIHILLVGDPGVGKSQLLKYIASIAPRGIYTTGKGSTAAGLTAAVVREKSTGDFYLEAGALVLADGGVACIDEFEKMDPKDRVSIHECMEQQSYHKDFEILLADGRKIKIGKFIDTLIESNKDKVIRGKDTEILFTDNIYVLAYDPITKKITRIKADRISRHKAPSKFIRITFSNGRTITVTPEHPIVVWKNGKLETERADEIKPGTLVPGVAYYTQFLKYSIDEKTLTLIALILGEKPIIEDNKFTFKVHNSPYLLTLAKNLNNISKENEKLTIRVSLNDEIIKLFNKKIGEIERIPPIIYGVDDKLKRKFIRILFERWGTLERDKVIINAPSRELAEDIQDLLLTLAIPSIITDKNKVLIDRSIFEKAILQGINVEKAIPNLYLLSVKSVEVIENKDSKWVYDITVEPHHLFVSHGLVLHNTISIAKAGIVATLNARTSILAAANPAFGRYLRHRTIAENIDLPVTILSRFDLIFIITDIPNAETDRELAEHVVNLHSGDYHKIFSGIIPPDLLRKYVAYARRYIHPKLSEEAKQKIIKFYTEMRAKSENPNSPITITPRQLEALIRLAEAQAKMKLSDVVTEEDAQAAIELMMYFLQSVGLDVETDKIDIDIVMTGKPMSMREKFIKLIEIIKEIEKSSKDGLVKVSELIEEATSQGLDKEFVERALEQLRREGEIYEPKPGYIKRT